jgi:GNAT superfamily N-acetyltransferase
VIADSELYRRGMRTAVACWEEIARWTPGAAIIRASGWAAAVFTAGREREVYNNAVLEPGLDVRERDRAIDAIETAYASARVTEFAVWVHEHDVESQARLRARGYTIGETTRAMGMALRDLAVECPAIEFADPDWDEYLRVLDVPGILLGVDPDAFHVRIVDDDGSGVATGMSFDHGGDCGIFSVTTVESARRRGIGTALVTALILDARDRGCVTATLQSTEMAERVYATIGFRDLGRILEYVPRASTTESSTAELEGKWAPPIPIHRGGRQVMGVLVSE